MPITYDRGSVFASVRASVFAGHMTDGQVAGLEAMLAAWERLEPAGDARFLAYMLGTAKWETASTMQPIEEYGHGRGRSYGVPVGPWHQVYDGRGDVQLTWEANYRKATARLRARGVLCADEDLERTPALAMRPDVAAAIMIYGMVEGWFTGKKLADYFHEDGSDWTDARRIINGTDHARDVAGLAEHFEAALVAAAKSTVPAPIATAPPPPSVTAQLKEPAASPRPAPHVDTAAKPGLLARVAAHIGWR